MLLHLVNSEEMTDDSFNVQDMWRMIVNSHSMLLGSRMGVEASLMIWVCPRHRVFTATYEKVFYLIVNDSFASLIPAPCECFPSVKFEGMSCCISHSMWCDKAEGAALGLYIYITRFVGKAHARSKCWAAALQRRSWKILEHSRCFYVEDKGVYIKSMQVFLQSVAIWASSFMLSRSRPQAWKLVVLALKISWTAFHWVRSVFWEASASTIEKKVCSQHQKMYILHCTWSHFVLNASVSDRVSIFIIQKYRASCIALLLLLFDMWVNMIKHVLKWL